MIELKSDLIDQYLKINNDILAVFGSSQCKHCVNLKPLLHQLSQENPEKEIIYIDGDKFPNSADLYNVEKISYSNPFYTSASSINNSYKQYK